MKANFCFYYPIQFPNYKFIWNMLLNGRALRGREFDEIEQMGT